MALSEELRLRTLDRFAELRRAWEANRFVRTVYADLYERLADKLPSRELGPRVEIGSGAGFAREFIPDLELSDVVRAPWHDREVSADALPFEDRSLGALVMLDVLHHLPAPAHFFAEAARVLRPGGRIVMCEPYLSPISYVAYKLFHVEPLALGIDPLRDQRNGDARDPFDSNQAIPTVLFGRARRRFEQAFPELAVARVEHFAGISYPTSGGFSRRPMLPWWLWSRIHRLEKRLPKLLQRPIAFRMLVTVDRR